MSADKLTQAVDVLLAGVPQLIADAERYRKALERVVTLSHEQGENANHQIGRMRGTAESALEGQSVDGDAERYKRERDEAVGLLWKVSSDEPCRFDHYGYCQEHGWFDLSVPCPEGRAQTFLARIEHDDREAARAPH